MKRIVLCCIVFLFFVSNHLAYADWYKSVSNYSKSIYELNFQNWAIDQSWGGWIYAANSKGLLEYDGIDWKKYSMNNAVVRSVKCVGNYIYVGGSSEFGYFVPDGKGGLQYNSLASSLNDWGEEIWNIHALRNSIYFQADYSIIRYTDNKLQQIASTIKLECSTIVGDKIYCGTSAGIYYLDGDKYTLIKKTSKLAGKKIVSILNMGQGEILIVTNRDGIYRLKGTDLSLAPISKNEFVLKNQLFKAQICDSTLVLGSVQNGILVVNLKTNEIENYSVQNNLQNNTVLNLFFDKDKCLWLGLDKGIDYINLAASSLKLDGNKAIIGSGYDSSIKGNAIYLATNQGVFYSPNFMLSPNMSKVQMIAGTEGQSWGFLDYDNTLFCANDNSLLILNGGKFKKTPIAGCWQLTPSATNKDVIVVVLYEGIGFLKKINGDWVFTHRIETKESFLGILPDSQSGVYWIMNAKYGISKIKLSKDYQSINYIKCYGKVSDICDNLRPCKINDQIVFCLKDGIYCYNQLNDQLRHYVALENKLAGKVYYDYLKQDIYGNIWYSVNNRLFVLRKGQDGHFEEKPLNLDFKNMLLSNFENVKMIDKMHAVLNTNDGFSIVDLDDKQSNVKDFKPFIREVIATSSFDQKHVKLQLNNPKLLLPYSENAIQLTFGVTDFTNNHQILYSYRLKGEDKTWSLPTTINTKEYTSLSEGRYCFELKTIVDGENVPKVVTFWFSVSPPWYRSLIAYIFYSLMFILFFSFLFRLNSKRHKKIIVQKKQELIDEQQKYLKESILKDKEIVTLQNEKLMSELNFKTNELTSSTLNVIRKNEILQSIRQNAQNLSKSIDENMDRKVLKIKTLKLITEIDVNIQHDQDFEKFSKSFDELHHGFFKELSNKYPNLLKNEKLLCAYLRMDLSSKEIAPLLNISVRGVEISRYRLRKKLNLNRDINLSDFMKKLF